VLNFIFSIIVIVFIIIIIVFALVIIIIVFVLYIFILVIYCFCIILCLFLSYLYFIVVNLNQVFKIIICRSQRIRYFAICSVFIACKNIFEFFKFVNCI